jgi:GDPmannose 4,6-dehydratase
LNKVCLITGITGQDGSYLAESLLLKGYEVHGLKRRSSSINTTRIDHIYKHPHSELNGIQLHHADMTDSISLAHLVQKIQPDEIYNLAAQSHVAVSFEQPEYTAQVDAIGVLRLLEISRLLGKSNLRIYQASTSELFGNSADAVQNELTPLQPVSPYGVAKLYAYWLSKSYRDSYSMFISNGILFNHESPRRGETFVSRKITRALSRIALGSDEVLYLGNLKAKRDWGHARDYVEAMHLILQHNVPDDFVVATGEAYTVKDFVNMAAQSLGMKLEWQGEGAEEIAVMTGTSKIIVKIDPLYFRPTDVQSLLGDSTKIRSELNWSPRTSFAELVEEMVKSDYDRELGKHTKNEIKNSKN